MNGILYCNSAEETVRKMIFSTWENFCNNIPFLLNQSITVLIISVGIWITCHIFWALLEIFDDKILSFPIFIVDYPKLCCLIDAIIITIVTVLVLRNKLILFSIF